MTDVTDPDNEPVTLDVPPKLKAAADEVVRAVTGFLASTIEGGAKAIDTPRVAAAFVRIASMTKGEKQVQACMWAVEQLVAGAGGWPEAARKIIAAAEAKAIEGTPRIEIAQKMPPTNGPGQDRRGMRIRRRRH